jgi:predicted nucleotidyltransferase component of viral defense system
MLTRQPPAAMVAEFDDLCAKHAILLLKRRASKDLYERAVMLDDSFDVFGRAVELFCKIGIAAGADQV